MKRVILTPTALPTSALAELKQWLGITTAIDDGPLTSLLRAALAVCEAFIGTLLLEAQCEEALPVCAGWHQLATRPVHAVGSVMSVAADGTRTPLLPGAWESDLLADGSGRIRLSRPVEGTRAVVRFTAGLAHEWGALPEGLRHGIVRLAAHQHRARDGDGAAPLPPASVAALWRPWRRMRLA